MRWIKTFEAYSSLDEYKMEIVGFLKRYNLLPTQVAHLMDFYDADIREWYESGKYTRNFAEKIAKDLELDSGGMMQFKIGGGNQWQNIYYR